jgi:RNA polymerase sigma factor (TIGR02999 family)
MTSDDNSNITTLLKAWTAGDEKALHLLTPKVELQLRRMAHRCMRQERPGNTLQTTALVNEAYLRLADASGLEWQDRAHFFALCARLMRRILSNAARARGAAKRGGQAQRANHSTAVNLDELPDLGPGRGAEITALDDALDELEKFDPRKVRVIEMRFFVGLSVDEIAAVLGISPQSVMRDWKLAKAWLKAHLNRPGALT